MADKARALKLAGTIKKIVARALQTEIKDPRLEFVTITDVRVTGDLQQASVFYTVLGDEAAREDAAKGLAKAKGRLRSLVGAGLGIRLTPTLEFHLDAVPETAASLDRALHEAHVRDEELRRLRENAQYAGEADPYRKPEDEASDEDES
ncbi:30S ribosome-binding factor RbfA [Demequina mangrovi]|uniref:Ribosome-binding factor A n=1 Tax=Demequina mangrovi TaxID=1043493 RepID=A0A1H6ZGP5_9MICO|nr:30S ribosome-binding factor RbfA [Demequina mangrovi]SEJ48710.1 ribosome-binding factor A [Demequina mangrovi]